MLLVLQQTDAQKDVAFLKLVLAAAAVLAGFAIAIGAFGLLARLVFRLINRFRRRPWTDEQLGFYAGLSMVTAFVGIVAYFVATDSTEKSGYEKKFRDVLPGYIALAPPAGSEVPKPAYFASKALLIDLDAKALLASNLILSQKGFAASKPSEVGTLVFIRCSKTPVGRYSRKAYGKTIHGGTAYRSDCTATLYDVGEKRLIGAQSFEGPAPSNISSGSRDKVGEKPFGEIVDYLKTLPAKTRAMPLNPHISSTFTR